MKRVEAILYAATAEEGRQILMDTQQEFAGRVFLEEDEAAAQVGGVRRHSGGSVGGVDYCGNAEVRVTVPVTCITCPSGLLVTTSIALPLSRRPRLRPPPSDPP